jgi:hypothetical protein
LAPFIEILQLSFCVMNYAHLVYGMQMASAARAWMYRQPQEDWENFLSGVNGFLNQAEADMRNRGVQAMLCPCIADHAGPLVQHFLFTKIQSLSVSNWYC